MKFSSSKQNQASLTFLPDLQAQSKSYEHFSPSEFLSAIIHELKTPISAIIGLSEILKEEINNPKSTEECADFIKEINQLALDLNELVHDFLDVGQIASGNFSVTLDQKIDIKDVIKRAVKMNCDYALRRNISLKTEIADDIALIKLDPKRMKQILTNLVSNAIKYSPEKSEIKIFCTQNCKALEIIISDQGFGMASDQIQIAFQKYRTISNPNSGKVDSFGLGLPITKQLVELQGGTIEIKSKINEGTEVILKFQYQ